MKIAEKIVVVAAIKDEGVGIVASARDAESCVGAGCASITGIIGGSHAGLEQGQVERISSVERQVLQPRGLATSQPLARYSPQPLDTVIDGVLEVSDRTKACNNRLPGRYPVLALRVRDRRGKFIPLRD